MHIEPNYGECVWCGSRIHGGVFSICCEAERKIFSKSVGMHSADVEVKSLKSIAKYCSNRCRSRGRKVAMTAERIPLPTTPPSRGPIEVCSKCRGVVDTTQWHLVYAQTNDNEPTHASGVYDVKELAMICNKCAPV